MTLAEFLLARIEEAEEVTRHAAATEWFTEHNMQGSIVERYGLLVAVHLIKNDPAHVLAECEAKRAIVERYRTWCTEQAASVDDYVAWAAGRQTGEPPRRSVNESEGTGLGIAVRFLALPYAQHPDYQQEWKP